MLPKDPGPLELTEKSVCIATMKKFYHAGDKVI